MSGITAIFNQDGTDPGDHIDSVLHAMDYRGWDGSDAVIVDRVALGHQHSYTTPEELGERQPISLDGLWITFDGRVDNRAVMFEQLADAGKPANATISDAELVLRAYRAFGNEVLERLVGPFALAIWNPSDERLLVARDKTGIRKLYYADVGGVVVVASEMPAIQEHPAVSADINEGFLGEVLSTRFIMPNETFFADVDPIEVGSFLEVTPGGTRSKSYWEVWNADVERNPNNDVVEEFRDRLQEAVACRLRAPELPGVMMSGGLDSTAIAGLARRHLDRTGRPSAELHSFSLTMDGDFFEGELDRIDETIEAFDLQNQRVRANDHFPLKDIEAYERAARASPVFSPVIRPSAELYRRAADAGRNVLLLGVAGNVYDGSRLYYTDLVRQGRFGTFLRDALVDRISFRQLLVWYVFAQLSDRFGQFLMQWTGKAKPDVPEWIATDFAERYQLSERVSRDLEVEIDEAAKEQLYMRYFRRSRWFEDEAQRQVALRAGVDLRAPYLDPRLLAYMISIPTGELMEAGQDKALFRRAMKGILPEVVRTQSATINFNSLVAEGIYHRRREYFENLFADSKLVELGIVDEEAYEAHVGSYLEENLSRREIWDLGMMELWLRQWT